MNKPYASWDHRVERGTMNRGILGIEARRPARVPNLQGETPQAVAEVVDHAPGALFVGVGTTTARIVQVVIERKKLTKVVGVGETVRAGEVSRAGLQAVPLSPLTEIKLQDKTSTKEVSRPNSINHLIAQAKPRTRGSKEDESSIKP